LLFFDRGFPDIAPDEPTVHSIVKLVFIVVIAVNLEDLASLPGSILQRLKACERHFMAEKHLGNIREIPAVASLIKDIDHFCSENMVIGFHYTRAIPEDILTQGLQPRSGEEIRAQFLSRFGDMFTPVEISTIKAAWATYYDKRARSSRDHRIWFNFTRDALNNGGADLLLKYYGGEQVYFCIVELPGVGEKLSSIGQPLIVKCALLPAEVRTSIDYPWGSIALSAYHRRLNHGAYQTDQDGRQSVPVPPDRIELIYP
jgi:hypothetical protein